MEGQNRNMVTELTQMQISYSAVASIRSLSVILILKTPKPNPFPIAMKLAPEPQQDDQNQSTRSSKKQKMGTPVEVVDIDDDFVDGFSFSAISNKGHDRKTAISVEQYSEERDIQLAMLASLQSTVNQVNFIDLSLDNNQVDDDDDDDLRVLNFKPQNTPFGKRKGPFAGRSVTETGQSSYSKKAPPFVCEICVEPKSPNESFSIHGCTHSYCNDCMTQYVASKLQENITNIRCPAPGCTGLLEPENCHDILPREVFDRWGNALCEAMILESQKFYCPFKDCSALLIDDGKETVIESECPNCRRMFCAQCRVAWHSGIECSEFQKLHKDEREREDIMLMNLAQQNKWRRCPCCKIYVEKVMGCFYMTCRCGYAFCYNCGARSNSNTHFCHKCMH